MSGNNQLKNDRWRHIEANGMEFRDKSPTLTSQGYSPIILPFISNATSHTQFAICHLIQEAKSCLYLLFTLIHFRLLNQVGVFETVVVTDVRWRRVAARRSKIDYNTVAKRHIPSQWAAEISIEIFTGHWLHGLNHRHLKKFDTTGRHTRNAPSSVYKAYQQCRESGPDLTNDASNPCRCHTHGRRDRLSKWIHFKSPVVMEHCQ